MAGSFYIYDKGNWCNLDINKGRLNNGQTVRFAFVWNDKLHLVSREKILKALRDLSVGLPSSVKNGSLLPFRRSHRSTQKMNVPVPATSVQSIGTDAPNFNQEEKTIPKRNQIITTIEHHSEPKKRNEVNKTIESKIDDDESKSEHSDSTCKELYIDSEDIEIMKNFLSNDNMLFDAVDIDKFDTDDDYRNDYLFLLNPLVTIEKQVKIDQMAQDSYNISINEFVNMLGLTHIDNIQEKPKYKTRQKNIKTKKENENKENVFKKEKQVVSDSSDFEIKVMKPPTKKIKLKGFQPKNKPPIKREYSLLEDHSIVAWLSSGKRSSLVNGNRIWREMQQNHVKLTGIERSWHSLRNRYLRYILPSLPSMRLDDHLQTKLRADAAKGEIKLSRKRRNSIYESKPVESAWSKRPKVSNGVADKHTDEKPSKADKQTDRQKVQNVQKKESNKTNTEDLIKNNLMRKEKKIADVSLTKENGSAIVSQHRVSRSSLRKEEDQSTNKRRRLFNPKAI